MTPTYLVFALWSGYFAFLLLLFVAHLHRQKLIKWATEEKRWLLKESDDIQVMRKFLVQQNTWDTTRGYYGNPLMNAAFDARVKEYNRRRDQWLAVTVRARKLLPW